MFGEQRADTRTPRDAACDARHSWRERRGLGSVATALRTPEQVRAEVVEVRRLTGGLPFAVNVTRRPFERGVFDAVLAERPPVISLALGDPGDLVERVHAAGCLFIEQVTTVKQAVQGVNLGTRFLASSEARIADEWKQAVVAASAEDAVKVDFAEHLVPPPTEGGWLTVPRRSSRSFPPP